jgi:ABC-type cobalt transport system substrate-binding protein
LKNLSTRIRIIALIILVALPALGLTVINAMRERATADARARQEITQLAQIAPPIRTASWNPRTRC